ncbi:hypothetical protein [Kitasatospora paranensis]|uniref:Uncharacterized protein n=1 Tax=Kitasatospora paranensis TaxID=258053 RepID=A0ABW2FSB2_9ACTN
MSLHVHVRVRREVTVTAEGEIRERLGCSCGEEWTRTHRLEGDLPSG